MKLCIQSNYATAECMAIKIMVIKDVSKELMVVIMTIVAWLVVVVK